VKISHILGENITYFFIFFHKKFAIPNYYSYIYYIIQLTKTSQAMTTAELQSRIHIGGRENYAYYICYESPAGWIYNDMTGDTWAVERAQNTELPERAKCKNGMTLRQALERLREEAARGYTHDEHGTRIHSRIK
jgi:hypothetical protein